MLAKIYRTDGDIRRHQINTLKVFNDNVVEIRENQEYQITFRSGGRDLCLKISLGMDFPQEKPVLKITPPVNHPWVSNGCDIISAPGLLNFTLHSDLGRVVQVIIREFTRNPPPIYETFSPIKETIEPHSPTLNPQLASTSAINSNLTFPDLNHLTIPELEQLLRSEERQSDIISQLPTSQEQKHILEEWIQHIENMAHQNLNQREKLEEAQQIVDTKIEEVTKLAFENEQLFAKYQDLASKYSPDNIRAKLRLAAEESEQESEKIADDFLTGQIDVDQFLSVYIKKRTLCHQRKTKEERLSQQLDNLKKAGF